MRTKSHADAVAKFWTIADYFRERGAWHPCTGHQTRHFTELDGRRWIVAFKIHALVDPSNDEEGDSLVMRPEFSSSVTIWPPRLRQQDERRFASSGLYKKIMQQLDRLGYDGRWERFAGSKFGNFWKGLGTPADVRREAKRMQRPHAGPLPVPGSPAGERTSRGGSAVARGRSVASFWAVGDYFRHHSVAWPDADARYLLRRKIDLAGKAWTMNLEIYADLMWSHEAKNDRGLHCRSHVWFWPPALTKNEEKRLADLGWHSGVARILAGRGYAGVWKHAAHGIMGSFKKDLPTLADVRREAKLLENFQPEFKSRRPFR